MPPMDIQQVTHLPPQISTLEKEAVAEGFKFLTRLTSEWHSGSNRFDAPGECLISAYQDQHLVGIGGLSVDPFTHVRTGRLRRVYVSPASRGQQVGRRLVSALLAHAALHFESVRLYTDTAEGSTFYLRCGFTLTEDAHATHIAQLKNLQLC
ncbi:GNAT family N-acetyltransferase [Pseudomonas sp. MYb118]|uniref:GNAT family N-acetyltransferase n=1 Tax=Pseudomonas sp. MYb118 TaxID=1848720 RepID=UPI0034CEDA33